MTSSYAETPETRINDLVKDVVVAGHLSRGGRLTPEFADRLAERVKAVSADMIEPGDAQLLRHTAGQLERVSLRIKAGGARTRAKASNGKGSLSVPHAAPQPDYLALSHAADLEALASGAAPFSVNGHEEAERRRSETQNAMLAAKQRKLEADRRAQVAQDEPETPWWR